MKKPQDDVGEIPADPRETVLVLLRLKLGRAPSASAVAAIGELGDSALPALQAARLTDKLDQCEEEVESTVKQDQYAVFDSRRGWLNRHYRPCSIWWVRRTAHERQPA